MTQFPDLTYKCSTCRVYPELTYKPQVSLLKETEGTKGKPLTIGELKARYEKAPKGVGGYALFKDMKVTREEILLLLQEPEGKELRREGKIMFLVDQWGKIASLRFVETPESEMTPDISYKPQAKTLPTNPLYKVGDRVKSKVWTDIHGEHPWLTVKGVYTAEWMGLPIIELEVTDGIQTNRVFEDTIIAHQRYPHISYHTEVSKQPPREPSEIVEVLAAEFIQELKTGAWKKQLNRMSDGTYMIEVYWEPWISEAPRVESWEKILDSEEQARGLYSKVTSIASAKKLLVRASDYPDISYRPQASTYQSTRLDGLEITKAYKQISRHGEDKIAVSLQAWALFPRGRRPHMISMYRSGDNYIVSPLYGHIAEPVYVPVSKMKAWIKSLPVRHFEPMRVAPEHIERAERLAREVDGDIEIISLSEASQLPKEAWEIPVKGLSTYEERQVILKAIDEGKYVPDDVLESLGGYLSDARFSKAMRNKEAYLAKPAEIPKARPAAPEVIGKKPYEMTKAEYEESWREFLEVEPGVKVMPLGPTHKDIVERAISKGWIVPPEVLKDYPDLAKQYEGKIPKALVTPEVIPEPLKRLLLSVTYEKGRFLTNDIQLMSKAERDAIDTWLVKIKHPLAYEPGTQLHRIESIAKELALKKPEAAIPKAEAGMPEITVERKAKPLTVYDCDRAYSLAELKDRAKKAGLSASGDKKELCRKLIAAGAI